MPDKIQLQLVVCQLHTPIDNAHRKNDVIYTDYSSYKILFKDYSNLIQSVDELFNIKHNSPFEYIMTEEYRKADVYKKLPNNLTQSNIVQKVIQKIYEIPDEHIDKFDYVLYTEK